MAEASRRVRHNSLPAAVLTLGAAQSVLVALALSRFLDPGWTTFGPVGVLSGLGMAGLALLAVRNLRWRRDVYRRLAWVGVLAGVLTAVVWASLLGGPFYMNDLPRVAIVVVSDCLFAIALVSAAQDGGSSWRRAARRRYRRRVDVRPCAHRAISCCARPHGDRRSLRPERSASHPGRQRADRMARSCRMGDRRRRSTAPPARS